MNFEKPENTGEYAFDEIITSGVLENLEICIKEQRLVITYMLLGLSISKCPTSQHTVVQVGWTSEIYFVCSRLNEQLYEEAGEHGHGNA